jgi:hypothetical protein
MTISVLKTSANKKMYEWVCFGNKNNATGAGSLVVVECENVLLPSLGKTIKELPFSKKEE